MKQQTALAPLSKTAVSLKDGHDSATARELLKRFKDAQNAGRRIMSFGLFAWEIKTVKLKHGQWGPWLAAHCPDLCRPDAATGKPKPSASLSTYMGMTEDILADMGFTIEKYFAHISNSQQLGICHGGKFLTLPDKKLPEPALKLKQEICNRVDNKTAKQIRFAFGQVEEDPVTEKLQPKRGRLKGQGGASKEQRAAAAAAEEAAKLTQLEAETEHLVKWIDDNCNDQQLGKISDAALARFLEACRLGIQYAAPVIDARAKAQKGA